MPRHDEIMTKIKFLSYIINACLKDFSDRHLLLQMLLLLYEPGTVNPLNLNYSLFITYSQST